MAVVLVLVVVVLLLLLVLVVVVVLLLLVWKPANKTQLAHILTWLALSHSLG